MLVLRYLHAGPLIARYKSNSLSIKYSLEIDYIIVSIQQHHAIGPTFVSGVIKVAFLASHDQRV
jgi:hypothetical protein